MLVLAILAIAAVRGLFLGLIREVFSLGALAAACIAVRFFVVPAGAWLRQITGDALEPLLANVLAGVAIALGVIALGAVIAQTLRRGVRAVGLGWLDRAGGGVLGAAEGALIAGIGLLIATTVAGRDHPLVADSRSLEALERVERIARGQAPLPTVAAPPERQT